MVKLDALRRLLALPDPPELPARGYHYTHAGKHLGRRHRRETLAPSLERAYWEHQSAAAGLAEGEIVSVQRFQRARERRQRR